jgi:predicted transposase YbfD/YdcC
MHNGQQSEIVTVQTLLDVLELHNVCFTMDALHTQKNYCCKTRSIIELEVV